jgi:prepilin-type N-terminal cleavage/methylation domain-containing protein
MSNSSGNRQMIRSRRARLRGVSLIELMVALVISLVLIAGAIQVYVYSRQNYDVNESVSRLQETARYALSVLEPDIRMANSWGLVKGSAFIEVPPAGFDTNCGTNFAGDLMTTLGGNNNQYSLGCEAFGAGAVDSADTLVVRRASVLPATATSGRLLVCSTRSLGRLVDNSSSCTPAPTGQVNDLIVNAYYVDRDANHRASLPTLRRWGLLNVGAMAEAEIVPGVEDMQIQFGIDPTGTRGTATRYVNPGETFAGQIVSVRLWLLVRSETPEQSFTDRQTYEYGDRASANGTTANLNDAGAATRAYVPNDRFRRLLVSKTIQIRNAMGI